MLTTIVAPPARAQPSRGGASPLRLGIPFGVSSLNSIETTRRATPFKPKNDSKANWNLRGSFQVPPPAMLSAGRLYADWIRNVDWRTEIRGHEPVRTLDDHRFRPRVEQGARPDGTGAAGTGSLHRHRRSHHPGKEATEAGIAGSDLLGRTCGGAAHGLDQVGTALSSPRPTRRHGGKARHPTQRE